MIRMFIIFTITWVKSTLAFSQFSDTLKFYNSLIKLSDSEKMHPVMFVVRNQQSYSFYFPGDTNIMVFPEVDRKGDTIINTAKFGPYWFKKRGKKIYFTALNKRNEFRLLFLLKKKEKIIKADIFSSSPESSFITSVYSGKVQIDSADENTKCYKFIEYYEAENRKVVKEIYISRNLLIPIKINSYNNFDLLNCIEAIELKK